jgi:hypothetical protein
MFILTGEGKYFLEGLAPLSAGYSLRITGRLRGIKLISNSFTKQVAFTRGELHPANKRGV